MSSMALLLAVDSDDDVHVSLTSHVVVAHLQGWNGVGAG